MLRIFLLEALEALGKRAYRPAQSLPAQGCFRLLLAASESRTESVGLMDFGNWPREALGRNATIWTAALLALVPGMASAQEAAPEAAPAAADTAPAEAAATAVAAAPTYTPLGPDMIKGQPVDGALDQRVGVGAIWYPQPFGIEAEWNIGRGPQLSDNQMQIESAHLHGGYLQAEYRHINELGEWFPFVRWQYYTGGRKFADNAPQSLVNEIDFGIEWSPWDELELVAVYSHTFDRTNVKVAPYNDTTDADRIEFQVQLNY